MIYDTTACYPIALRACSRHRALKSCKCHNQMTKPKQDTLSIIKRKQLFKTVPKSSQKCFTIVPKRSPGGPWAASWPQGGASWPQVAASCSQVGPKVTPSWRQVGPSWPQVGPKLAQIAILKKL